MVNLYTEPQEFSRVHGERTPPVARTEAIALVEQAVAQRGIPPGTLPLGTDNGSSFTARAFKLVLSGLGIAHRRGGYRDPESQAFIESWFAKLKERCVWLHEFETLDEAREVVAACRPVALVEREKRAFSDAVAATSPQSRGERSGERRAEHYSAFR